MALVGKNPPTNAEDTASIRGMGKSPRGGNGNSLQYSRLETSMERGACGLQRVTRKESDMTEHTHTMYN